MTGAVGARSRSSLASSTPPCEAASISTTSRWMPSRMATHWSHTPHGSAVGPFSQLTILARMRAVLPEQRYVVGHVGVHPIAPHGQPGGRGQPAAVLLIHWGYGSCGGGTP